jgi:hypothetical protein
MLHEIFPIFFCFFALFSFVIFVFIILGLIDRSFGHTADSVAFQQMRRFGKTSHHGSLPSEKEHRKTEQVNGGEHAIGWPRGYLP